MSDEKRHKKEQIKKVCNRENLFLLLCIFFENKNSTFCVICMRQNYLTSFK